MASTATDLDRLLRPERVALVGASEKSRQTESYLRNLAARPHVPTVYLVNPNRSEVFGHPCYPSLAALPAVPDVVALQVPGRAVLPLVAECADLGVSCVHIFSAGFAEEVASAGRFAELKAAAERIVVLGPAAFGVVTPDTALYFGDMPARAPDQAVGSSVALLTQSGGLLNALVMEAPKRGLPIRYAAATGQEAGLGIADLLSAVVADPNVQAVGIILEEIKRVEAFDAAMAAAQRRGVPVVVLKAGASRRSQEAVLAHSGSLAGDMQAYRAYFRKHRVTVVENLEQLVSDLVVFSKVIPPRGRGVAMVTISGGECTILPDLAEKWGLDLPRFAPETGTALDGVLRDSGIRSNPLDASYVPLTDQAGCEQVLTIAGRDPGIDLVLTRLLLKPKERYLAFQAAQQASGKPMVLFTRLAEAVEDPDIVYSLPVVREMERAVIATRHLLDFHCPAAPVVLDGPDPAPAEVDPASAPAAAGRGLPYSRVRSYLEQYRLSGLREMCVTSAAEAAQAAKTIGYPVVMKLLHPDVVHKTERNWVHLGLDSPAAVQRAFNQLAAAMGDATGTAAGAGPIVGEIWVSEMVAGAREAYLGMHFDARFGPGILLGLGGIWVELLHSAELMLPPITEADFQCALSATLLGKLLAGYRSRQRYDISALGNCVQRFADLCMATHGQFQAIDINPLFVLPGNGGVRVGDAKFIAR